MNEIEALRAQVGLERRHMAAVRNALAAMLSADLDDEAAEFCALCCDYLLFIVRRFNAQDQAHVDTLLPRIPQDAKADRDVLIDLDRALELSRAALEALAQARERLRSGGPPGAFYDACRRYVAFYDAELRTRKHGFYHLLDAHYGVADWRKASLISADSILQERRLFAAARAAAPPSATIAQ
jgi:hypothetical protein